MRKLRDGVDVDAFFGKVAEAPSRVLLVDYDGTLAPFREERDLAVPYPGVREVLRGLLRRGESRVVVVSGRSVDDVGPLLGLDPRPEIWGNHGWERYVPGGGLVRTEPPRAARSSLAEGLRVAREAAPEERVEEKPVSVAVHVRGMGESDAREMLSAVEPAWEALAEGGDVELHDFDGGLELRVPGLDKGTAVRTILADEPEDVTVAYLGDDRTDEDAFLALEHLGDRALRVLVRPEPRSTAADLWLRPPGELLDFLERWRKTMHR